MSSPFGHSLAGYIITAYESKTLRVQNVKTLMFYLFVANAPDLDFVPGIIMGKPNLFHHGISHSLGAAVLCSCLIAAVLKYKGSKNLKKGFLLCFSLYCSHLFLDYISIDGRPPFGIPLFWPLSHDYFILPNPILPPIMHSELDHATIGQFLDGVFSFHNLYVAFLEFFIMTPFILIVWVFSLHCHKGTESR